MFYLLEWHHKGHFIAFHPVVGHFTGPFMTFIQLKDTFEGILLCFIPWKGTTEELLSHFICWKEVSLEVTFEGTLSSLLCTSASRSRGSRVSFNLFPAEVPERLIAAALLCQKRQRARRK